MKYADACKAIEPAVVGAFLNAVGRVGFGTIKDRHEIMAGVRTGDTTKVRFVGPDDSRRQWALLIPGNGLDIVSDHGDDGAEFAKAVEEFFRYGDSIAWNQDGQRFYAGGECIFVASVRVPDFDATAAKAARREFEAWCVEMCDAMPGLEFAEAGR